ncbi:MAG TPA: hypothetical protein VGL03_12735 [Thermoanaerobaculia bacterium]|jgi:hypothetical protein
MAVVEGVFNQLLPQRVDNTYRGHKLALWLFGLLVFMKAAISLNSIFNGYSVARSADGIPLDTFTPAGAQTVVTLFGLLGISQLMFCLLGILVLARYRAVISFMFALMLLEHLSRRLILQLMPIVRTGKPPGTVINLVLLAVMIVGLALSLWSRDDLQAAETGQS